MSLDNKDKHGIVTGIIGPASPRELEIASSWMPENELRWLRINSADNHAMERALTYVRESVVSVAREEAAFLLGMCWGRRYSYRYGCTK